MANGSYRRMAREQPALASVYYRTDKFLGQWVRNETAIAAVACEKPSLEL